MGEVDPLGGCCEDWPIQWISCFMGSNPTKKESLSGALVTAKSTSGCVTWLGSALVWSEAGPGYVGPVDPGRGSDESQNQQPLVWGLGSLGKSYKVIYDCLSPVLVSEIL